MSEVSLTPAQPGSRHSVVNLAFLSRSAMPALPPPTDSFAAFAFAANSAAVCFFGFALPVPPRKRRHEEALLLSIAIFVGGASAQRRRAGPSASQPRRTGRRRR